MVHTATQKGSPSVAVAKLEDVATRGNVDELEAAIRAVVASVKYVEYGELVIPEAELAYRLGQEALR